MPVDWVDDPDSRVDVVATAREDLKGIARLARDLASGAIPVAALRAQLAGHDPRWPHMARYMRGGFWRNFKVKYPEADEMYTRMMMISGRLHSARQKLKVQLQAALFDAGERTPRASDGAEGAEIGLVRWWSWLILWVKGMQAFWQTRSSLG